MPTAVLLTPGERAAMLQTLTGGPRLRSDETGAHRNVRRIRAALLCGHTIRVDNPGDKPPAKFHYCPKCRTRHLVSGFLLATDPPRWYTRESCA